MITKDHSKSSRYLDYLEREIDMQIAALKGSHTVAQLHWGGGTPTFLTLDQMSGLIDRLDARFGRGDTQGGPCQRHGKTTGGIALIDGACRVTLHHRDGREWRVQFLGNDLAHSNVTALSHIDFAEKDRDFSLGVDGQP